MTTRKPSPATAMPVLCLGLSLGAAAAFSQATPSSFTLTAKVRDFKERNPTDSLDVHPHFNNPIGCSAQEKGVNTVAEDIDAGGSADSDFPSDNRNPVLLDPLPDAIAPCYDPPDRFADWFNDRGPDINRVFLVDLPFVMNDASGLYEYRSEAFFPLDAGQNYRKIHPDDPDPFGNLQTGLQDGQDLSTHDYGFTMELHGQVDYTEGAGQVLRYEGDDDIWVFINGKRVVDLGGVHQSQTDSVDLDAQRERLGLEDGGTYPLDFFFAERHIASSSLVITTNATLATPVHRPPALARALPAGKVSIFDRLGRRVRTLSRRDAWSAGGDIPAWDRRDAAGNPAVPGIYLWRAEGAGRGGALVVR